MRATLRFLLALARTNVKASLALRGAFLLRAAMMIVNNGVFFVVWWVFFERYEEVRGFRLPDMAAVYAVCTGAFGLTMVLGGGVRDLARLIAQGDLDSYLGQPKSPLVSSVASRSESSGWGDLVTSVALFAVCGYVTPGLVPVCVLLAVSGAVIFLSMGVMLHSLAFWLGDTDQLSRQAWEFLILFSVYPGTIFSGWIRVLLFSAIPAGFITFLPVGLLRSFSWGVLAITLGAALAYAGLAALVFRAGLKRYESGSRFTVRA